jgi:hypothetical protein
MLKVKLDELDGIAILEPNDKLSESDFLSAAQIIDPYIKKAGTLEGIIIHAESFPGWDSFGALVKHLTFVKDHHTRISRVAFATDSPIGNIAEHVVAHFVNADVKHFGFAAIDDARKWIMDGE